MNSNRPNEAVNDTMDIKIKAKIRQESSGSVESEKQQDFMNSKLQITAGGENNNKNNEINVPKIPIGR